MAKISLKKGGKTVNGKFVANKPKGGSAPKPAPKTNTTSGGSSGSNPNLEAQLASVAAQAKGMGIDTSKADSMLAQTKAEGDKSYAGSSYEQAYNTGAPIPNTPVDTQGIVDAVTDASPTDNEYAIQPGETAESYNARIAAIQGQQATGIATQGADTASGQGSVGGNGKTTSVTGYQDNADGTTTNFTADGGQDTGTYSANPDGSLSFNPGPTPRQLTTADYQMKKGESIPEYNDRIARLRGETVQGGGTPYTQAKLSQKYGLTQTKDDFDSDPINTIKDITKQIFSAMGYDQANSEYKNVADELEDLENDKDDEIREINDNPWLTEGVRLRQIQKTAEKYEERIGNRTSKLQLLDSIRDDARQQAQFAIGTSIQMWDAERKFQQSQQQMAYDQAQREFENQAKLYELSQGGGSNATSEMQEYMFTVDQGFKGSFLDYKMAVAAAGRAPGGGGGGNSNQMTDNERALFGQFRGEPIVKDYNTILAKKLSVDAIIKSGVGGPGDLALVYEFMKGLDPTSVVRETEYATAAKSGNIFAGVLAKYNGYLKPEGGFLPPQVQGAFQSIVDSKFNVQTQLYNNVSEEYRNLAQRQGLNPDNVAIGYSNASQQPVYGPIQQASPEEQLYDTTVQNTGGYLGNLWNALTPW